MAYVIGKYITKAKLSMYSSPSSSSVKVCDVPNGTIVNVTKLSIVGGDTYGYTSAKSKYGYIKMTSSTVSSYNQSSSTTSSSSTYKSGYYYAVNQVKAYSQSSLTSSVVFSINSGTRIQIKTFNVASGASSTFGYATYNGKSGYVLMNSSLKYDDGSGSTSKTTKSYSTGIYRLRCAAPLYSSTSSFDSLGSVPVNTMVKVTAISNSSTVGYRGKISYDSKTGYISMDATADPKGTYTANKATSILKSASFSAKKEKDLVKNTGVVVSSVTITGSKFYGAVKYQMVSGYVDMSDFTYSGTIRGESNVVDDSQYTSSALTSDANGDTNGTGQLVLEEHYLDTTWLEAWETDGDDDSKEYLSTLSITDMRQVFGMPHQFIAPTDPRLNGELEDGFLGRKYSEKIIRPIPLLLITPGEPQFMSGFSTDDMNTMVESLFSGDDGLGKLVAEKAGSYYSLKYAQADYYPYVNSMLRSAAFFLGIENLQLPGTEKPLSEFNWMYDSVVNMTTTTTPVDAEVEVDSHNTSNLGMKYMFPNDNFGKFIGQYRGCIPLYVDAGTSVDDSFSNQTTQSALSSSVNGISDAAREVNFLLGTASSQVGGKLPALYNGGIESLQNLADSLGANSNSNLISNILGKGKVLLTGGKMVFPEIWSDSSFSRSYSVKMKLIAPAGDKLSIFLNILVPIYHVLALVLPRHGDSQAYSSPFLVRAYCKSLFNVDMGIITSLSITKGAEGEWTKDGLPTVAELSFEIKDLYDNMYMSASTDFAGRNILANITELDYIATTCGININDQDIVRTAKMAWKLGFTDVISDKISIKLWGGIQQSINNKIAKIVSPFSYRK